MNRKQEVILGLICILVSLASAVEGSSYNSVWSFLLSVVFPVLIVGTYILFAVRDRSNAPGSDSPALRQEAPYIVVIVVLMALLIVSSIALGV